jgi:Ca2+:H+ antiporter
MLSIDAVKRKAHREAWYGDSANPFRRTRTNASDAPRSRDLEAGDAVFDAPPRTASEPILRSRAVAEDSSSSPTDDPISPTTYGGTSRINTEVDSEKIDEEQVARTGPNGEQSSEETVVEARSIGQEEKNHNGLMSRFRGRKDKKDELSRTQTGTSRSSKRTKGHKKFTVANQIKGTIFNSWINILLICAPIGIALHFVHSVPAIAVFVINFVAIIPLAALLSYATEEIALRVGEVLGGLLNATFGYVGFPCLLRRKPH